MPSCTRGCPGTTIRGSARFCAHPGAALLYPGPLSASAEERFASPPEFLVVVDGTWHQAEQMIGRSERLKALPRLKVTPDGKEGYGELRREPWAHGLSTLEAVALALSGLEGTRPASSP